ncbi:hypothetical protein M413DRAFT_447813 [Hebeloma cylindrosporum]|uniref:Uncharacterized protein n=1 Tax=Hebeloma cylindrosporum TaxID=76867 RepID=A0A0C3C203_HEBCY|nr:hypothetical protein M413DRAFT_447813 [Hebeloma cylindrosporum h7]
MFDGFPKKLDKVQKGCACQPRCTDRWNVGVFPPFSLPLTPRPPLSTLPPKYLIVPLIAGRRPVNRFTHDQRSEILPVSGYHVSKVLALT